MSDIIPESIINSVDFSYKPDDLMISTMTIVCKFPVMFNVRNICKYIDINKEGIKEIKFGKLNKEGLSNRKSADIKETPQKYGKKKKKKNNFYNQVTLIIKTQGIDKFINLKLFKNGSIQMTGCKSIEDAVIAINKLFIELNKKKGYLDHDNNKFVQVEMIYKQKETDELKKLDINQIYDFKVVMINSNFKLGMRINRENLYKLIMEIFQYQISFLI